MHHFRPRHLRPARIAAVTLLLVLWHAPAVAQDPDPVFRETIGVEVLTVDVVVTDKKGRPILGLTRDDFELLIDGRRVPITNFHAVSAVEKPASPAPATLETPGTEGAGKPPRAAREPVHLVVLLEDSYLSPGGRKRVLQDLPEFLEHRLAEGTRVMLAVRDAGIRVLTPFTTDADGLRKALAEAAELPARGIYRQRERLSVLSDVRSLYRTCEENPMLAACEDCFEGLREAVRFYGLSVENQKRASFAALDSLVGALGALEGRKALLHVSDGIQERSGFDLYHYLGELCPQREMDLRGDLLRHDSARLFNDLVAGANASRVTLYTLDAEGLRGYSSASVEFAEHRFVPSPLNDKVRIANLQSSLFFLSNETGGRAILNTNRFAEELEGLATHLGNYYSLGYQPGHAAAGETHRVAVEVTARKARDARLRYRRSLMHKEAEQILAERTLGAALFGQVANPLEATASAGAAVEGASGRLTVPIEVRLPLAKMTLLPGDGGRHGRLKLVVAAPDGDRMAIRKKDFAVAWPGGAIAPDRDYRVGIRVDLPAGRHLLGVGLWDELAASGSFLGLEVTAGAELSARSAKAPEEG